MLDNLGSPAGEGLDAGLELFILPAHLDGIPSPDRTGAGQGKTALLGVIGGRTPEDFRVQHHQIGAFVLHGNDALVDANHVGSHAHTALLVENQGFQKVRCHRKILRYGRFERLRLPEIV